MMSCLLPRDVDMGFPGVSNSFLHDFHLFPLQHNTPNSNRYQAPAQGADELKI